MSEPTREPKFAIPPRLMVDGNGYCWREFDADEHVEAMFSMCPVNPDNAPIPNPWRYYVPEDERQAFIAHAISSWRAEAEDLEAATVKLREAHEVLVNAVEQAELLLLRERFDGDTEARVVRAVLRSAKTSVAGAADV